MTDQVDQNQVNADASDEVEEDADEEETPEWELLRDHEDYEICKVYPYQIRKVATARIVSEYENGNGYEHCKLNGRMYYKHRLIALQWLPNPENLNEIDHIDRNRSNNHIDNLRWVSHSENHKNKTVSTANTDVVYEYFDKIDDDSILLDDYGEHVFDYYYYSENDDAFYFWNGLKYRKLHVCIKKTGLAYVHAYDRNGVDVKVYFSKFKRLYGFEN